MNAKDQLRALLAKADVEVNGARAWDIQVHHEDLYDRVMAEERRSIVLLAPERVYSNPARPNR